MSSVETDRFAEEGATLIEMGFIGVGNMGGALAQAAAKRLAGEELLLANRTAAKAEALAARLGCKSGDNEAVASSCRYVMLAVKPQKLREALAPLTAPLAARQDDFVLVTMAAGVSIARLRELAGGAYPVIRIMPNTPCAIGQGTVLCCRSDNVSDAAYARFKEIMGGAGTLLDLDESLIDAGSAVSGCGPAYVYTFIESMADAAVACGLTRADALSLAASTVAGAAQMVLESGRHPAQLRDSVCSPGGSTIAGVLSLERGGFRAAVADCVRAAFERTQELGK